MTTKASDTSRGRRTARTPPLTSAAATRPPTAEAAAFSGWPSIRAATASGSSAPAAAAAATARAADEPSPRAMGILRADGDGQPVGAGHVDGHPGRQVRRVVGHARPFALGPDHQAGGRLHLHLDVEVEREGQGVEAGSQIGRRRWSSCAHTDTVLVGSAGRTAGIQRHGIRPARDPGSRGRAATTRTARGRWTPAAAAPTRPGRRAVGGGVPTSVPPATAGRHRFQLRRRRHPLARPPEQPGLTCGDHRHPVRTAHPKRRWPSRPAGPEWSAGRGRRRPRRRTAGPSTTGRV